MENVLQGPQVCYEELNGSSLGERYFSTLDALGEDILQLDAATGITETARSIKQRAILIGMELKRIGIKEGDVILISCISRLEEAVVFLGVLFVGGVIFCIHPDQDYQEFCMAIRTIKPALAFCDKRVAVNLERVTNDISIRTYVFNSDSRKTLNRIYDKPVDPDFVPVKIEFPKSTVAFLLLTDGIMSYPKIVKISHYTALVRCKILAEYILKDVKTVVEYVPLVGSIQVLLCCASFEYKYIRVIPRTFTERDACRTIRDLNIDLVILGTEKAIKLAEFYTDYLDFNIDCLSTILIGGMAASRNVLNYINNSFEKIRILHAFFCLEGGFIIGTSADFCHSERSGSCGNALPGVVLKIVDLETNEPVGPYTWGALLFKNESLAMGYIAQKTDNMYDGFFKTGDVAEYDAQGYIYIHGRLEDIFTNEGKTFCAISLHAIAYKHENMYDVVACLQDGLVYLYCVMDNRSITATDIFEYLEDKLEPYMMPNKIIILTEFPRSVNGKIKKYLLKNTLFKKSLALVPKIA